MNMEKFKSNDFMYNELLFFNNSMIFVCFCIPLAKFIPYFLTKNEMLERKINQYTNWNIFMIFCNYILKNVYDINNIFLNKFIALNSFQIFVIYHSFVLYDYRVLFDNENQNSKPLMFFNIDRYNKVIIKFEYFILNILIHVLPVYYYSEYILSKQKCGDEINMGLYTLLLKFFWALNVFGNFNVVSIYIPTYSGCHITLFNVLVIFDYISGVFFQSYVNYI